MLYIGGGNLGFLVSLGIYTGIFYFISRHPWINITYFLSN